MFKKKRVVSGTNLKNGSVSEFQPVQRGSCHEDSKPMIIQKRGT